MMFTLFVFGWLIVFGPGFDFRYFPPDWCKTAQKEAYPMGLPQHPEPQCYRLVVE